MEYVLLMGKAISRYCFCFFLLLLLLQFWPYWVQGLRCCMQAFSIAVIRGYPLVAESGLLTAVAYFVEHGL